MVFIRRALLIGYVDRIEVSKDGLTQTLYLKGEKNYNNMDYVIVVEREAVTPNNGRFIIIFSHLLCNR